MSDLWRKAQGEAEDARLLFRSERYDGASSRAYYAMFNAARVLLKEQKGLSLSEIKRHASLLRLFSKHFIEDGPFDPEFGPILRRASDTRIVADYEEAAVGVQQAKAILDAMERFMSIASAVRTKQIDP